MRNKVFWLLASLIKTAILRSRNLKIAKTRLGIRAKKHSIAGNFQHHTIDPLWLNEFAALELYYAKIVRPDFIVSDDFNLT